jgi:hypothetical protein
MIARYEIASQHEDYTHLPKSSQTSEAGAPRRDRRHLLCTGHLREQEDAIVHHSPSLFAQTKENIP